MTDNLDTVLAKQRFADGLACAKDAYRAEVLRLVAERDAALAAANPPFEAVGLIHIDITEDPS